MLSLVDLHIIMNGTCIKMGKYVLKTNVSRVCEHIFNICIALYYTHIKNCSTSSNYKWHNVHHLYCSILDNLPHTLPDCAWIRNLTSDATHTKSPIFVIHNNNSRCQYINDLTLKPTNFVCGQSNYHTTRHTSHTTDSWTTSIGMDDIDSGPRIINTEV